MNLLKKLFKKNKKIEEEPNKINYPICEYCKREIFPHDQIKTYSKKKYHLKPCWKIIKKEIKKMVSNGSFSALKYMK